MLAPATNPRFPIGCSDRDSPLVLNSLILSVVPLTSTAAQNFHFCQFCH